MIQSKQELNDFLKADAAANSRSSVSARLFGDGIWKFIVLLRKSEYYSTQRKFYQCVCRCACWENNELRRKRLQ